ncbi:MAG: hypothetical protein NUW12_08710 [Firmicutes bacterium]|nr:hypothetical protein [Bacillota bacterium]MDH7496072.1 hypothetical protein [Bacillota bacterium]
MHEALGSGQEYDVLDYTPDYWVVNGRSYPDTVKDDRDRSLPSQPSWSRIVARVGQRLLSRIANTGFQNHGLYLGGLVGRVVAGDSYPLATRAVDASYERTTPTIGSCERLNVLVILEVPGECYIRDRDHGHIVNRDMFPGGMIAKVEVAP